ncbi:hypothetical protein IFM89_014361, partial [Coptis chinensis]
MGNIVSSAVMVPKELITQRMQASVVGRSWQVLLSILQKDRILGLYVGYTATLLRNLPAGVLSYSSFEYLKAAVLAKTKKGHLEPFESVCCGALAGAIAMAFLLGGNNQLDTLIWYSWLGGIIIGTMIGSNMGLEEHYKAGPRNIVITGSFANFQQLNNAGTNKGFRPLLQFADEDIEQRRYRFEMCLVATCFEPFDFCKALLVVREHLDVDKMVMVAQVQLTGAYSFSCQVLDNLHHKGPSPRKSSSPRVTPPYGGDSSDKHSEDERSPGPRSVSQQNRRANSRSPSPRNFDADVFGVSVGFYEVFR